MADQLVLYFISIVLNYLFNQSDTPYIKLNSLIYFDFIWTIGYLFCFVSLIRDYHGKKVILLSTNFQIIFPQYSDFNIFLPHP